MKTRILIVVLATLPALAFAMSRGPGGLNGTYTRTHEVMAPGETDMEIVAVGDRLRISNDDGGGFDFHAELVFSNYHTCEVSGSAHVTRSSMLGHTWYFKYEQPAKEVTTQQCVLEFEVSDKRIELHDADHSCADMCGARGRFDGVTFERSTRQDIKD